MSIGSLFMLLAAVGVLRLPDLFTRMQASTKSSTLGVACILLAVAVHFGRLGVTTQAVLVVAFFFLTTPVAAHMIARAAYVSGVP
jgi:multicomponent Na+:H+ antiporter subunit G